MRSRVSQTFTPGSLRSLLLAGAAAGLAACQPWDGLTVALGDPVPNVLEVSFETGVEGQGRVVLVEDRPLPRVWPLGEVGTSHDRRMFGVPSGTVRLRPEVVREDGTVVEGPVVEVKVPPLPDTLPAVTAEVLDPNRSVVATGMVLFNTFAKGQAHVMAVDARGRVVWWRTLPKGLKALRSRTGRDGNSILFASYEFGQDAESDLGQITRWTLGEPEPTITRAVELHHDFVELPDGELAWLSFDRANRYIEGVGIAPLQTDALRVAPEGAVEGEERRIFSLLDDAIQTPDLVCEHMLPGGFGNGYFEWSHSNSLAYEPSTDSLRFLARYWDAVLEVGLDGTLHWQAGGEANQWDLQGWFNHGHATELSGSDWWVFSNNNHAEGPNVTDYVRLAVDAETGTVTETARIADPFGRYASYLGDVRSLPNGNILVAYSPEGQLLELTPEGDIVWELHVPEHDIGRVEFVPSLGG